MNGKQYYIKWKKTKWSENVILVDADYVDAVAFNLIVNFERMLNRPIPKADLAQWLVCAALDGGVGEGKNDIQVVFIHGKGRKALENFTPSDFEAELDGKAFCDGHLGEFKLSSVQVENLVDGDALYLQSLEHWPTRKASNDWSSCRTWRNTVFEYARFWAGPKARTSRCWPWNLRRGEDSVRKFSVTR